MRVPIEDLVGSGWDQLLALVTLISMVAAGAGWFVVFWLQSRLGKFFVSAADHKALVDRLRQEHVDNVARMDALDRSNVTRMDALDRSLEELATKHSMKGIEQKVSNLSEQLGSTRETIAGLAANIQGVVQSNVSVEHMMSLVLSHMLQRDKKP